MTWKFTDDYPPRMLNRPQGLEVFVQSNKYGYDFKVVKDGDGLVAFMAYIAEVVDDRGDRDPIKIVWAVVSHGGEALSKADRQVLKTFVSLYLTIVYHNFFFLSNRMFTPQHLAGSS